MAAEFHICSYVETVTFSLQQAMSVNPLQRTPKTQQKAKWGNNSGQPRPTCELRQPTIPRATPRFPSLVHRPQHHLIHPRKPTDSGIQKSGLWPTLAPKLPCPLLRQSPPPALCRNCRTHRGLLRYKKPLIPFSSTK